MDTELPSPTFPCPRCGAERGAAEADCNPGVPRKDGRNGTSQESPCCRHCRESEFDHGSVGYQVERLPLQKRKTLTRQRHRFAQNCTLRMARLDWWNRQFVGCVGNRPLARRRSEVRVPCRKSDIERSVLGGP